MKKIRWDYIKICFCVVT